MSEKQDSMVRERNRGPTVIILAVIILAVAVTIVFALFMRGSRAPRAPLVSASPSPATAQTERVLVAVEGMSCTGCSSGIQAMLKRTPGVISAEISLERKEGNVEFDPSRITPQKIVEAINDMGYQASVKP